MTVREWNCIAELIAQKYDDYDGFVVLHGTDTMAYTASALSFMLDGLDKPVVLTGSQIPLCEIRSDGRDNLITAPCIRSTRCTEIIDPSGLIPCIQRWRRRREDEKEEEQKIYWRVEKSREREKSRETKINPPKIHPASNFRGVFRDNN